jgi:hypothetical protein
MSQPTPGYPALPTTIRKRGHARKPSGQWIHWTVVDEIVRIQSNRAAKALYLQQLKRDDDNGVNLRLGYYIIGQKPRMKGKWVWGESAAIMPAEDFKYLFEEAKRKGWL